MSFGPPRDGQHTFQRLDHNPRWAGVPDLDDAGPRAITAYLRTYGPATLEHVHYWLGDGLSAGRKRLDRWFAGLGDRLVAVDVEGTTAYVVREDVDTLARRAALGGRAVPSRPRPVGHGTGHQGRPRHPAAARDAVTRKANPVIVGGVVRGTWARKGDGLTVTWLDERRHPTGPRAGDGAAGRPPRSGPAPQARPMTADGSVVPDEVAPGTCGYVPSMPGLRGGPTTTGGRP